METTLVTLCRRQNKVVERQVMPSRFHLPISEETNCFTHLPGKTRPFSFCRFWSRPLGRHRRWSDPPRGKQEIPKVRGNMANAFPEHGLGTKNERKTLSQTLGAILLTLWEHWVKFSHVSVCMCVCECTLYVNKPMGNLVERCCINQIRNNKWQEATLQQAINKIWDSTRIPRLLCSIKQPHERCTAEWQ